MPNRTLWLGIISLTAVALIGYWVTHGEEEKAEENAGVPAPAGIEENMLSEEELAALEPRVSLFCGHCHSVPKPETFPRDAWYDEVAQGYRFYEEAEGLELDPPPMSQVVAYYRSKAPEKLAKPEPAENVASPIRFRADAIERPADRLGWMVSYLRWGRGVSGNDSQEREELLFCDLMTGTIARIDFPRLEAETIHQVDNPAHLEIVDLDADGREDFLIADLGSRNPADHADGRVVWLRRTPTGSLEEVELITGVGRVADLEAADFDQDGDLDIVVAEFGWRKTGSLFWLEQTESSPTTGAESTGNPTFVRHEIDQRHGTSHVDVVDLNHDQAPDFVALISQEFELIVAFLNDGQGGFRPEVIHSAGEPSYGSSGIEVADMDGDGDLDVLYSNGDTLDSYVIKPYHGVQWLENTGTFPFTHHWLTPLVGASRAINADLDDDGDLDIACTAYLPPKLVSQMPDRRYESLIWLEQISPGKYERHLLESSSTGHLALCAGDFDGDGDTDLAAGECSGTCWITVWWNEGRATVSGQKTSNTKPVPER